MSEQKRDAAADLAMCEAATPGPWVWSVFRWHIAGSDSVVAIALEGHGGAEPIIAIDDNDARFIAESRTALPHWINRAVAAEAEVERLREALRAISTYEPPPGCEDIGIGVMNHFAKRALEKT